VTEQFLHSLDLVLRLPPPRYIEGVFSGPLEVDLFVPEPVSVTGVASLDEKVVNQPFRNVRAR
jgi:hypothetical protein